MPVTIRHIKRLDAGYTGASRTLLGRQFEPMPTTPYNDGTGWQTGDFTTRVNQEGEANLVFPNAGGSDSTQHRQRFGISKQLAEGEPSYMVGDEYVEIYSGADLLWSGTPLAVNPARGPFAVGLTDPWFLLRKHREYYAGHWHHAPRDVWEHYTQAWRVHLADDFTSAIDGRFATSGTVTQTGSVARLAPGSSGSVAKLSGGSATQTDVGWDEANTERYQAWQLKVQLTRSKFGDENEPPYGDNAYCRVGMESGGTPLYFIQLKERTTSVHGPTFVPGGDDFVIEVNPQTDAGDFEVIVEGRERWVYFFLNQALVYVLPIPPDVSTCVPFVSCRTGDGTSFQRVEVDNFVYRRTHPFLMKGTDKGTYRLPGLVAPGGLWGKYYNDSEAIGTAAFQDTYASKQFSPFHDEPVLERLDPLLDFTAAGGYTVSPDSTWQPRGASPDGLWWSVRWTGSIYLALGDSDLTLQYTTQEEGARMWVGKTRMGEQYLDNWMVGLGGTEVGGSLRDHIGESVNGWYPIVIEYGQRGTQGAEFQLAYGGGSVVLPTQLSPYGIFDDQIRGDSHWGAINTLIETFGYQTRFEPKALEDAAFPGQLCPRVKVGRDSNKILTQDENENFGSNIDASDVALAVLGDAAGMALDENGGQLAAEIMDYARAEAATMLLSEYEQTGDITHGPLLEQRLRSMMALRSSGWESVNVQPPGTREVTDTFPITGAMAALRWDAGDGVRLNLPRINVIDSSPRQILSCTRTIVPAGLGAVQVSFRSRPRDLKEFLQRVQRRALAKGRNYQGQYVATSGSLGVEATTEDVSWLPLPKNLQKVKQAVVYVIEKPDGDTPHYIWINDKPQPDLVPVTKPGVYDISKAIDYYDGADLASRAPVMKIELKLVSA
jgi:hypothetical protein